MSIRHAIMLSVFLKLLSSDLSIICSTCITSGPSFKLTTHSCQEWNREIRVTGMRQTQILEASVWENVFLSLPVILTLFTLN